MRKIIIVAMLICAATIGSVGTRCQMPWLVGLSTVPSLRSSGLGIYEAAPMGNGWAVAVGNDSYSKDHFNGLIGLDPHGNLAWTLSDTGKLYYAPAVVPLEDGNVLYVQGGATSSACEGSGTNFLEISPWGQIVRSAFLNVQGLNLKREISSGDLILTSAPILLKINVAQPKCKWGRWIQRDPPVSGLGDNIDCLMENADGTIVVAGHYAAPGADGNPYFRYYFAKIDPNGAFIWYRTFSLDPATYFLSFTSLASASDGGYLLFGGLGFVPTSGPLGRPFLLHLSEQGDLVWQKGYCFQDNCYSGSFAGVLPSSQDGFMAVGNVSGPPMDWPSGFIMKMDGDGLPLSTMLVDDAAIPSPYLSIDCSEIIQGADGFLVSTSPGYGIPPWLMRLDEQGDVGATCSYLFKPVQVSMEDMDVLSPCQDTLVMQPVSGYSVCSTPPSMISKALLFDETVCGDIYPAIVTTKKLQNPLRLKLMGWNFQEGSTAFIDGTQVPSTLFKGTDSKTNQTKLILKGGKQLSRMLPKGQQVILTVLNPDGHESEAFPFAR